MPLLIGDVAFGSFDLLHNMSQTLFDSWRVAPQKLKGPVVSGAAKVAPYGRKLPSMIVENRPRYVEGRERPLEPGASESGGGQGRN